jgi:hypothetical protein
MLITLSGSQGCGKTTTLNAIPPKYPHKQITRKTSRSILSDWGVTLSEVNNDRKLTIKFQDEILKRKIADEYDAAISKDMYLTERTFADLFVYALVAIGKDNEYSDWLDDYYLRCVDAQKMYTEVYYLTAGHFQPVNDGVRGINQHYSDMVDMVMSRYTMKMTPVGNLRFIDTPVLEDRVRTITTSLFIHNFNRNTQENK